MKNSVLLKSFLLLTSLFSMVIFSPPLQAAPAPIATYVQTFLVSDEGGAAKFDSDLINPWGIIAGPGSIWVANNGTSMTKAYRPSGQPFNFGVHTPGPGNTGDGFPTGIAFNETKAFMLTNGIRRAPATFLIATRNGTIAAWNQALLGTASATNVIDQSSAGASYTGIAIALNSNGVPQIYAANFRLSRIDVFDAQYNLIGIFSDTDLPAGFSPYNIRNIRGKLFVTFARLTPDLTDDLPGPGFGYIDIFDTDGTRLRRFASNGPLNSPWGMTVAPRNFGKFKGALLVANSGDGRINGFDIMTGQWLGSLTQPDDVVIEIEGLRALDFETRELPGFECGYNGQRLYFSSGYGDGQHGLLGYIRPGK